MDPNVPTFNPDGGGYYDPNDQGDYVGYVGGYDHGASQQYANYDSHDATAVGAGGDDGDALYFDQMQGSGQASQYQYSDPTGEYGDVGVVGGGGTYHPIGTFQPHVQAAPISDLAFDPTMSAIYAASHTVSLGRRTYQSTESVSHGAYVAVHSVPDGTLFSANSSHPEAKASILDEISASIYGTKDSGGHIGVKSSAGLGHSSAATMRRPPPHAYRPSYSSSIDDPFAPVEAPFSVRKSHGMGIGSILPFSSGEINDDGFAATVSPSSVRLQTRGCACVSAALDIKGMTCGVLNPTANYDGSGLAIPSHVTVGGAVIDSYDSLSSLSTVASTGKGHNIHCVDLYSGLRIISSHTLTSGSTSGTSNPCVTCLSPNNTMSTLAAGCSDGSLRIFDAKWRKRGNKEVAKIKGHSGGIVCVCISEDGNLICTTGYSARSSFSSSAGTAVPYAFPDQHILIYDIRSLGRGGIAHSFSGERGGPRYAAFVPGDEKNRILVASGQTGGGLQIVTPYDDLQGTGYAEYMQPELAQGEKITALAVHGKDMALGTSQSNAFLFQMSEGMPTIPAASSLPCSNERDPVAPPPYETPQPEMSIEPHMLRLGAEDSTFSSFNTYVLNAKPAVSSLGSPDSGVGNFGPLSDRVIVPHPCRLLSNRLLELVANPRSGEFVVSVDASGLNLDLLEAEGVSETKEKGKGRRGSSESLGTTIANPNRLLYSKNRSSICYRADTDPRKGGRRDNYWKEGGRGETKDNDDMPMRYRLSAKAPGAIMSPSDYVRPNSNGIWPGWNYPPAMQNAWVSPIIFQLYFIPEIRSAILKSQEDRRLISSSVSKDKKGKITEGGPALSAELGYAFHQIEQLSSHGFVYPVIDDLPDDAQIRALSPSNLITLLTTLPEANQLQILDGGAVSMESARRPEAFYRFLIHHLDNELPSKNGLRVFDSIQGFDYVSVNEFVDVKASPTVSTTHSLTVELSYESFVASKPKKTPDNDERNPNFSEVLRHSLCRESRLRAWCKATNDYETIIQRKIAASLPSTLAISCSCAGDKHNGGLSVWKNAEHPARFWLPEIIEVELQENGNVIVRELIGSNIEDAGAWEVSEAEEVLPREVVNALRKSSEKLDSSATGMRKHRYQLDAVVSFIRSGGGVEDENDASGHHVLHARVSKSYDERALALQMSQLETFASSDSDSDILTLTSKLSKDMLEARSALVRSKLDRRNAKGGDSWILINGLAVTETIVEDARSFEVAFKEPCLVTFRQIDLEERRKEEEMLPPLSKVPFKVMNTPSLSTGKPPKLFVEKESGEIYSVRLKRIHSMLGNFQIVLTRSYLCHFFSCDCRLAW